VLKKRIFDLVFATLGLVLLSPLFLVIAICIRLDSPGPVFFRQERVGRFGIIFRIHKFRTMRGRHERERLGPLLTSSGDSRITKVGSILRRYKLDELVQLIDVVKGDMSLVGARPEVPKFVEFYPEQVKARILSLPPGMTDLASIAYRNENDILAACEDPEREYIEKILPDKLRYYEEYVNHRSLWLDFTVILRTITAILA